MGMFPSICPVCHEPYFWLSHTPLTITRTQEMCSQCWEKKEAEDASLKEAWREAFLKETQELEIQFLERKKNG